MSGLPGRGFQGRQPHGSAPYGSDIFGHAGGQQGMNGMSGNGGGRESVFPGPYWPVFLYEYLFGI